MYFSISIVARGSRSRMQVSALSASDVSAVGICGDFIGYCGALDAGLQDNLHSPLKA